MTGKLLSHFYLQQITFKPPTSLLTLFADYDLPDVKISVTKPVRKDDNVTIICSISPLTEDTEIVWFVSNGSKSDAIHNNEKYNVNNYKSINSSLLTIYSVQYTDELNYTCLATNVLKKRESSPMQLYVFACE